MASAIAIAVISQAKAGDKDRWGGIFASLGFDAVETSSDVHVAHIIDTKAAQIKFGLSRKF